MSRPSRTTISEIAALLVLVVGLLLMFLLPAPHGNTAPGNGWRVCGHTRGGQAVYCVSPR